jgi:hypothetical protein
MKTVLAVIAVVILSSFTTTERPISTTTNLEITEVTFASFSLINDTKEKVSIYTGSGFVSLNKGSKTSITCKVGKEVRWAERGSKKDVIFEITDDICGKTIKLSNYL